MSYQATNEDVYNDEHTMHDELRDVYAIAMQSDVVNATDHIQRHQVAAGKLGTWEMS